MSHAAARVADSGECADCGAQVDLVIHVTEKMINGYWHPYGYFTEQTDAARVTDLMRASLREADVGELVLSSTEIRAHEKYRHRAQVVYAPGSGSGADEFIATDDVHEARYLRRVLDPDYSEYVRLREKFDPASGLTWKPGN